MEILPKLAKGLRVIIGMEFFSLVFVVKSDRVASKPCYGIVHAVHRLLSIDIILSRILKNRNTCKQNGKMCAT